MTVTKAAGCPEIVACTPCDKNGEVNSTYSPRLAKRGATEVYRVGGAQAIAALACGTKTIRPVQKIFGPGNAYVVAAKRLLFGRVSIDLLPGPSELFVLADSRAWVTRCSQRPTSWPRPSMARPRTGLARHHFNKLITDVQKEIERQPPLFPAPILSKRHSRKRLVDSGEKHFRRNRAGKPLAPEHCELMLKSPKVAVKQITTAGAILSAHGRRPCWAITWQGQATRC